jgi:hypothetical protein
MGAFRAIAIMVLAFIMMLLDRGRKHLFRLIDLHADLGQVGQLHRRAVLVDQGFEIDAVELKVVLLDIEPFLWEVKGLRHQVGVRIIH